MFLIFSWCGKNVLPCLAFPSFPPLPSIPFPFFSSPAVPRGPGRAGPGGARRSLFLPAGVFLSRRDPQLPSLLAGAGAGVGAGAWKRRRMDLPNLTGPANLPKHILDIWVIVLIILATILIMTALLLCPATAVIIYRIRTHPTRNGIV